MKMKKFLKVVLLIGILATFLQSCEALDEAEARLSEDYMNGNLASNKNEFACPDGTIFRRKGTAWGCFDDNRRWF